MREGWCLKTFSDIAAIRGGKRVPKGYKLLDHNTGFPYIRVTNFNENGCVDLDKIQYISDEVYEVIKKYTITENDMYISIAGTIGKTGIIPSSLNGANITENACKLVFMDNIYNKYVLYFTFSEDFQKQAGLNTRTAAMPKLALTRLATTKINVPPLPEQKQIVAILDKVFAAIDRAKANIEKNIENAKELFQSKLNEIFSQKGEGWEEKRLGDVCEIASKLIDPTDKKYQDLLHVGGGNIVTETGELINLKTAEEEKLKSGKFVFNTNVVLYNKIRPYLVKVSRPNFNGLCSADMYPFSPNDKVIIKDFLYFLLISKDFTDYAIKGSARAGMPKVNRKFLFGYSFTLPSIMVQNRIIEDLDSLRHHSQSLDNKYKAKVKHLDDLKKSILQKAFQGDLL